MLYYTVLYYTILYYTILYYTILYYTILYYTILYYTILYCTTLYYSILLCTTLYYSLLYYTIPYYSITYYSSCLRPHRAVGIHAAKELGGLPLAFAQGNFTPFGTRIGFGRTPELFLFVLVVSFLLVMFLGWPTLSSRFLDPC